MKFIKLKAEMPHRVHYMGVIDKLPDCQSFGRGAKLRLDPDGVPDLHWNLSATLDVTPALTAQQSLTQTNVASV